MSGSKTEIDVPLAPRGPSSPPQSPGQVAAMISLLQDENPEIVSRCRAALRAAGRRAEPQLRERLAALGERATPQEARLLRRVLAELSADGTEAQVRAMLAAPESADLERGSILIGRLVDGGGEPEHVTATLDEWALSIAEETGPDADVDQRLSTLRSALARRYGLTGTLPHRADFLDAVLHGVTSRRQGMPLPLCMAWVLLARRLELPLVGVNMPGHFLLRLDLPDRLLILDPFHGGAPLDLDVCRRYLAAQGMPSSNLLALDASDHAMLLRTLRNVEYLSTRLGERELADRCTRLLRPYNRGG